MVVQQLYEPEGGSSCSDIGSCIEDGMKCEGSESRRESLFQVYDLPLRVRKMLVYFSGLDI